MFGLCFLLTFFFFFIKSLSKNTVVTSLRGLLLVFADGVGIGYQWIYDDDATRPVIDVIGELPWKACEFVRTEKDTTSDGRTMHTFEIRSVGATQAVLRWKFCLYFEAELVDLEKKFKQVQQEGIAHRKDLSASSAGEMRMNLLMKSDRYHANMDSDTSAGLTASQEWKSTANLVVKL